jgi:hypothetical protein
LFPLDNDFVGWLMGYNRKYIRSKRNSNSALATEYFTQKNNIVYREHDQPLFHMFQFLNFITKLESPNSSQYFIVEGKKYIIEEFYLADFMNFTQIPSTNSHQRTKLVDCFESLHSVNSIVEPFVDGTFRIFATFLYSGVKKVAGRLKVKVYIIEDLYYHLYSFIFSKQFINYKNRTDCLLKLQIMLFNSKLIQDKIEIIPKHKNASVKHLNINQLEVKYLNQRVAYLIFYGISE